MTTDILASTAVAIVAIALYIVFVIATFNNPLPVPYEMGSYPVLWEPDCLLDFSACRTNTASNATVMIGSTQR
jgi:hypothetical protein